MKWIESKLISDSFHVNINIVPDVDTLDGDGRITSEISNNGIYIANIIGSFTLKNGSISDLINIIALTPFKYPLLDRLIPGILLTTTR